MKTKTQLFLFMTFMLFMVSNPACAGPVFYVDDDAPLGGDGLSWETAFRFLQDGLSVAAAMVEQDEEDPDTGTGGRGSRGLTIAKLVVDPCSVEIRVAQGIYVPDCNEGFPEGSGDRNASFELASGMVFKGGYAGLTGDDSNVHDPALYRTILSGDLAGDDVDVNDPCGLLEETTRVENSYNVVQSSGAKDVVIEGVTISGGNAFCPPYHWGYDSIVTYEDEDVGGGILNRASSLTLRDCVLAHNSCYGSGGGLYSDEDCNLILEDCRFLENYTEDGGGGGVKFNSYGEIVLNRCRFDRNVSGGGYGIAIASGAKEMQLRDCTFVGNTDHDPGSNPIIYFGGGSLDLDHCVFRDNLGPGVYCSQAEAVFKDCLFQNNAGKALSLSRSDVNIEHCSFINHHSSVGGAVNITGYSSGVSNFVSIKNSLFCGNYASSKGGAIKSAATMTSIENCTFARNRSDQKGGALFSTDSAKLTVTNSIFEGNSAPSGMNAYIGQSYLGTHPSSMSAKYCLIEGGQDSITLDSQCTLTWGEGNLDEDPCFVDPGYWDANGTVSDANDDYFVNGDYHLKSQAGHWDSNSETWIQDDVTSLCVDAGDPNTPIMLEPFPNGGVINMGAYGGTAEASRSFINWSDSTAELNFCDYWLFAVGNKWQEKVGYSFHESWEINEQLTVNGLDVWTISYRSIGDHGGFVEEEYYGYIDGGLYSTPNLMDFSGLPDDIESGLEIEFPEFIQAGIPIHLGAYGEVLPLQGTLEQILEVVNTSSYFNYPTEQFPQGNLPDVLAFVLEPYMYPLAIFGRNIGPILMRHVIMRQVMEITITNLQKTNAFVNPAEINIEVGATNLASDPIVKVEFHIDNIKVGEDVDSSDGWSHLWINPPIGTYQIRATAVTHGGQTADSQLVDITICDEQCQGR